MTGGGQGDEPEETMPFTHRPWGSGEPDDPATSPSGPASQPSGPGYVQPPAPGTGWGAAWTPAYGPAVSGQDHPGATQSMILGIVAMACLVFSFACCLTVPGLICAPIAWAKGSAAKRVIDANPGAYGNRGQAVAGVVMGIIGSVCGVLMIVATVALAVLFGSGWSLV